MRQRPFYWDVFCGKGYRIVPNEIKDEAGSLARALLVLDVFTPEKPEYGVREIARELNLPVSTAGRVLASLHKAGVLTQDPATRRYSMGARVLHWGRAAESSFNLRDLALPILRELNEATGETATLSIFQDEHRVIAERVESSHPMRYVVNLGDLMPLHAGASGKVFLADMELEQRNEYLLNTGLEPFTPNTITDRDVLEKELDQVHENRYALSKGEFVDGVGSVASPIIDAGGVTIGAVNVCGPLQRMGDERMMDISELVVDAAKRLSRSLGSTNR